MSWRDPNFRYVPVAEQKEGYLKCRFEKIRQEQKAKEEARQKQEEADAAEVAAKVRKMGRK